MNAINIRRATINDAEKLLDFFKKVGGETDFLMMDENGVNMTIEQEQSHLKRYDDTKYGLYLVVTNENDEIVGQSAITQIYPNRKKAEHVYDFGVVILKNYWGRGIASELMAQLINHARQIGVVRLELHVRVKNTTAIKLYQKFGFRIEGTLKNMAKIDNQYQDEYIMALIF
jgi:RimJ/RimL family protein N-acetyltransferase